MDPGSSSSRTPGERTPAGGGLVLCSPTVASEPQPGRLGCSTETRRAEQRFPPVTRLIRGCASSGEASAHTELIHNCSEFQPQTPQKSRQQLHPSAEFQGRNTHQLFTLQRRAT